MRYVLAEVNENDSITIETVTDRPLEYVSDFEPIDIVDGKMIAWSEAGIKYKFGPVQELAEKKLTNSISIIDVGKWDSNGPKLIELEEDRAGLRTHLLNYLQLNDGGQSPTDLITLAQGKKT